MAYPDLDRDESIILETRNVKFKSISFDAILTSKRIILTDSKKNVLPPHEISLANISNVETGENAIRDHFLILTTITGAGEKHDTMLTFLRQSGGERKRECNEWAKKLKILIPPVFEETTPVDKPVHDAGTLPTSKGTAPERSSKTIPRPEKKKIEIARPLGKIREESPVSPIPIETSSLPSGTFCSRCGNRVPYESTYCNHCGTPIKHPAAAHIPAQKPVVPQVQIPVPPSVASPERQERPIEQIIHSIEPLIEDSVPRTHPSPLFQKQPIPQTAEPAQPELQSVPAAPVVWPVLQNTESPLSPVPPVQEPPPPQPASPLPPPSSPPAAPPFKQPNYLAIGILVIAILVVIGGLVVVANFVPGQSGVSVVITTTPAPTPQVTKLPSPTPLPTSISVDIATMVPTTTQLMIPPTGVWVRASYPGTYIGLIGTPGNQIEVTDSGDHFYQIPTSEGTVAAALQKKDGSADKIVLEIYKNGVIVGRESTVTPKGIVEIQLDLKTVQPSGGNTTR